MNEPVRVSATHAAAARLRQVVDMRLDVESPSVVRWVAETPAGRVVPQFREALQAGQITVRYQPQVSLSRRVILGVEALVRWNHPEFGELHPAEFVGLVEPARLDAFVLGRALARARLWLDDGLRLSVAVNLSARSLLDAEFPSLVAAALRHNAVPADLLTLELSELDVADDPREFLPVLRELHAIGVVLALDHFGTGYSPLAFLRDLPVDQVKIDRSFVLGMDTDLADLAVVRSIVELGHSLGLAVVAVGVEHDVVRQQLEDVGCDAAQGHMFSRPLAEQQLETWLHESTVRTVDAQSQTVLTVMTSERQPD